MNSQPNQVSIWAANLPNREAFQNFISLKWDEEGDATSEFLEAFEIQYLDEDFIETHFSGGGFSKEILNRFS